MSMASSLRNETAAYVACRSALTNDSLWAEVQ
jgi:hypothetical protein